MNLAQLRALRAVHEAGSVTGAAALLDVTQSAISHALSSLEKELGLRLVVRSRTGCSLTEAGRRLLPYAAGALDQVDRLAEQAGAMAGPVTGRLRLGAPAGAAGLLRPMVRVFRRRHPAVEVVPFEGTDAEVVQWIDQGIVELGVVTEPHRDLSVVGLAEEELVAVLPARHVLGERPQVSLADLAAEPLLVSGGAEHALRRAHDPAGGPPVTVRCVRHSGTLLTMVREGLGVGVVSAPLLDEAIGGFVTVPLVPAVSRTVWLASRRSATLGPAASAFVEFIAADPPSGRGASRVPESAEIRP